MWMSIVYRILYILGGSRTPYAYLTSHAVTGLYEEPQGIRTRDIVIQRWFILLTAISMAQACQMISNGVMDGFPFMEKFGPDP